jgi:DNA-binding SARP family transcriptional activator/tetratricopeptide (TPR) repeat protein
MLRLTLLGGLRASSIGPEERVVVLRTRKARALLAYLASPPDRAHPRDKLAALLWGDSSDSQAHTSLRQALYGLRRALEPVKPKALRMTQDTVALEATSVEVDALRFEQLVKEGTPAALEAAVALYQGELLEGLAIDAPAFEEWLVGERERLREQAIEAMAKLLAHQRSAGALEAAVQTGIRLLALEPAQESVHRTVIRLHLRLGRRGAARRQYQLCVDTLQRELGAEPEAETQQLYQEILRAAPAAGEVEVSAIGELSPPPTGEAPREERPSVENPRIVLVRMPFTGRRKELERLQQKLDAARSGIGGLTFLVGEPGIGKTRLLEEFTAWAGAAGARVLFGRCFEGDFALPFGPFSEAISSDAKSCDAERLREDLGSFGAVVAKIVPELRERFPGLPQPAALTPEEERFRLLDAVAQVLWAFARRAPLVLVLDDLHWADGATLALLRHLARFLQRHRVLIVGAYRDAELGCQAALADTVVALRREVEFERIGLSGLPREAVAELLDRIAPHEVPANVAEVIAAETAGNPFFLREILLHLLEEGKLERADGRLTSHFSIEQMGIPESLREVSRRRLARLSKDANRLLSAASGCSGDFRVDVAAGVAGLDEDAALNALDDALEARLVRPTGPADVYEFTHALIRHSVYNELSPSRQMRLHRRLAEVMEDCYGERVTEHALEIAHQWHRSAALPGGERGALHCVRAADRAERAAAHEETAAALRMALDLLPARDARRPRLLARLALALTWSFAPEEAVRVASEAGDLIATSEGSDVAADYLAEAAHALYASNFDAAAWAVAEHGLQYVGRRRDLTWALLAGLDFERHQASDPDFPGIPLDIPERHEISRIVIANLPSLIERGLGGGMSAMVFESREDAYERAGALPSVKVYFAGEYAQAAALSSAFAVTELENGRLSLAAMNLILVAHCQSALGNLGASLEASARARGVVERIGATPFLRLHLEAVLLEHTLVRGEGYGLLVPAIEPGLAGIDPGNRSSGAAIAAAAAVIYAYAGRGEDARSTLERVFPAIDRAAGWAATYTVMLYWVIEALWVLECQDHVEMLERNLRDKTLGSDFRYPHTDARLALARLCALTGRVDEAREWFDKARRILAEQGARPLRAITDFDEAWMEVRRGRDGDRERALALLDAARGPFESIGMPGWLRRADELRKQLERPDHCCR